jgi:dTMP kinase
MIKGHFIVLEGIDGSGTTTQASRLVDRFTQMGLPAHVTAEPSSGPIGALIRQILIGRVVSKSSHPATLPSWKTMSLLFAADRQDHVESEIRPNLREGVSVICDRYVYSSLIYQSLSSEDKEAREWILALNRFAPAPDLVIYLDVDPNEAMRRRQQRSGSSEMFDDPQFQRRLAESYRNMASDFPDANIVTVDCAPSIEAVTEACWKEIEALRARGGS